MTICNHWLSTGLTIIMICNMTILGDMSHNIVYGLIYLFMVLVVVLVVVIPAVLQKREVDAYCDQLRRYRDEVERIRINSEKHLQIVSDASRRVTRV